MSEFFEDTICTMPAGEFIDTCSAFELESYRSTDQRVPTLCKFEATCEDGEGEVVANTLYLPPNTIIEEVVNVEGHLAYGKKPLSKAIANENPKKYSRIMQHLAASDGASLLIAPVEEQSSTKERVEEVVPVVADVAPSTKSYFQQASEIYSQLKSYFRGEAGASSMEVQSSNNEVKFESSKCIPLAGSYALTCKSDISHYTSTDPNLANTELCEANLDCLSINENKVSSTVYFNIADKQIALAEETLQKVENCDGKLVIGNIDNRCNGAYSEDIKNIAEQEGKMGEFTL